MRSMRSLKNYENLTNTVENRRSLLKVALQNKEHKNKEKLMDCFLEDNLKALEELAKC
ncbi:TPA: hypothetical protein LA742_001267 [Clostridium botulinum]|uniref:hypothetical protein n=1 Tax=Clostridium sporogenes TaxID=1509 RepID=UPI000A70A8D6|nr:hypothetical protein [Clostridium sporogenes]HBJ2612833.1 hypothetical protein [Clostridium botulinum]